MPSTISPPTGRGHPQRFAALPDAQRRPGHEGRFGRHQVIGSPGSERFWPATTFGVTTDPRNVQHGVAGVIGALVQSWQCTGDHEILELVAPAATWLVARANAMPFAPVGVHFGAAGQAWSLFDAGRALGDDHLIEQAVGLALSLPPDWPGPDITHGRAGLGLTLLHFYRGTGQDRFLTAAGRCADSLLRDVERISNDLIGWRTPDGFRSSFAGRTFYGFAHGTAGIGTFLLEMAMASGREDCHAIASAAASSLVECCTRWHDLIGWGEGPRHAGRAVAALVQRSVRHRVVLAEMVAGQPGRLVSFPCSKGRPEP